jgi:hypothetical protein
MPKWTEAEDIIIRELAAKDYSAAQIGLVVHKTRNSVISRLHRIRVALTPKHAYGGHSTWTEQEEKQLLRLYYSPLGYNNREIAKQMGKSQIACESKLDRLRANRTMAPRPVIRHKPRPPSERRYLRDTIADAQRTGISLIDLKHDSCRWPLHQDGAAARFCGDPRISDRLAYCEEHCRRAYQDYW